MEPKARFADCEHCTLRNAPFVPSDPIRPGAKLAIVGESPGRNEVQTGQGFTGESGKLLWGVLSQCGISRSDVNVTNACLCAPPTGDDKPEILADAISHCRERLMSELRQMDDDCDILTLGKGARQVLFPDLEGEESNTLHGRWTAVMGWSRYALSTLHPAFILRSPNDGKTLIDDLAKGALGHTPIPAPPTYELVTAERVPEILAGLGPVVAFDIETDNVDYRYDDILMMVLADSPDHAYIFPGKHPGAPEDVLYQYAREPYWKEFWASPRRFIAHNNKFDRRFLRWQLGWRPQCTDDTMLMHYTLDERAGTHGLKILAARYLNRADYERTLRQYLTSRNDMYHKIPFSVMAQYAATDGVVTFGLYFILRKQLDEQGMYDMPYKNLLMQASDMFHEAEMFGVKLDVDYLTTHDEEFTVATLDLANQLNTMSHGTVVNPNSTAQLACYLYDELGLPLPHNKKASARSTGKEALDGLKGMHPAIAIISKYRRIAKMQSAYIRNMLEYVDDNDRVHYTAQLHGAEHGRISLVEPALQIIPRSDDNEAGQYGKIIKDGIIPGPGYVLLGVDYSQAELRVAAALSRCKHLIAAYENDRDVHSESALVLYGPNYTKAQRSHTKLFTFSYLYGGNEYSFSQTIGIPIDEAKGLVHEFDLLMPELKQWKEDCWAEMRAKGYVTGRTGRRRRFPFINRENMEEARKASFNAVDAGPASDLTLLSACRLWKMGYRILFPVHDSNILEVPKDDVLKAAQVTKAVMVETGSKFFPEVKWKAEAEAGERWGSMLPL